jgi:hypothetical protein
MNEAGTANPVVGRAWNKMVPPERRVVIQNLRGALGNPASEKGVLDFALKEYACLWPRGVDLTQLSWEQLSQDVRDLLEVVFVFETESFTNTGRLSEAFSMLTTRTT